MRRTFVNISFLSVIFMALCTLNSCTFQGDFIIYDDLNALLDDSTAMQNSAIIDIRAAAEWQAGYIPQSINIAYDSFINKLGLLKDNGAALTSIVTDKSTRLVIYGSGSDNAWLFASKAIQLGYKDVNFYEGGMADWREAHSDYLWITYEGFRQWYDAKCPFDDNINYLVDVHPASLYTGGHIPGAINITSRHFAPWFPDDVQELTDVINNKEAAIVFYCVGAT